MLRYEKVIKKKTINLLGPRAVNRLDVEKPSWKDDVCFQSWSPYQSLVRIQNRSSLSSEVPIKHLQTETRR